uniref:Ionotropic glutamate receptor L-glutamate and glycine-binding domain-containing protein n=1 Tax=Anopheles epiroticus TaxID=199890 RepID=A0A182P0W2_9DIPT
MPEAVVPWCLLLLLLTPQLPLRRVGLVSCEQTTAGVDSIGRTRYSLERNSDVRERLDALAERLVERQDPCAGPSVLIVFLEFWSAPDDDALSLAIESFTQRQLTPWMVFRVQERDEVRDIASSVAATVDTGSYCTVLLHLLPNLEWSAIRTPLQTTARIFPLALKLLLLAECPAPSALDTASSLLATLWWTEHALRATTVWYRCATEPLVGLYDPFEPGESSDRFYTLTDLNRTLPTDVASFGRRMNLRRTAITIYGFEAAMAYRRQDIDYMPRTFPPVDPESTNDSLLDALFGADVDAIRELACRMNFSPIVHHMRANFGFKMANGTFTGVLGRLVARDAWLSMNVYFLKDYETRELQFGAGVYQDSLCVFVQAAGMLPDWLLIFRCFTPTLWIIVSGTVVMVSLCYLALAQCIAIYRLPVQQDSVKQGNDQRVPRTFLLFHPFTSSSAIPAQPQQDLTGLVGQIVGALLTAPTNGLNRTTAHQKLFVAFGLIWGLTITGAFQGSLVDVYTTPTSMKNLDTLAELDASGLPISVTAPALIVDVFGTEQPGSTIGNLKQRLVLQTVPNRTASFGVLGGRTAGLIRNQDFLRLSTKHLAADGTTRLHRLRECPRSYTLAYLYPRGSPLFRSANGHILHFLQHGLYAKWQRDAAHILRTNRALKVHQYAVRSGRQGGPDGRVTLRLDHLLLPFMLLAVGLTLGAVCFVWERRCRPGRCV